MSRKIVDALRIAAVLSFLLATTYIAWGQGNVTTGTITGDVTDASAAVIAGAKVSLHNEATGMHREAVTDANGHFVVPQLPTGRYDVSVSAPGFEQSLVRGAQLNVDGTVNLKFTMSVGAVEQKVNVSAEATQAEVETSRTDVSNIIQEAQVRELPLNQRSFTALVTQQPGLVSMTNAAAAATQSPTTAALGSLGTIISSNGTNSQSMAYLIDGVNINNSGYGAPGTAAGGDIPGVEGIQEFKVLNQNYSAAYGGAAGAVVSFATRSGTNNYHGSVYEFLRNSAMDSREFFNNQGEKNPYRRNQFGATFGGPIRKDKTFFFLNYEALISRLTTTGVANVPDMAARNGGVGGTSGFQVIDPWGNQVAISPGVKALLNLYPLPNSKDFGNGVGQVNFPNYQPVNQHYGLVRIDQQLSEKDTLMARYNVTDARGFSTYSLPTFRYNKQNRIQGVALKWTRTVSNNLVNTLSVALQRSYTLATTGPTVPVSSSQYMGNVARQTIGLIGIGSTGGENAGVANLGNDTLSPVVMGKNSLPINDDLIYNHGAHTLKIGGQFAPLQWNTGYGIITGGDWVFNNLNDFLAGYPTILFIKKDGADPRAAYRSKLFAWYLEDAWRLKRNFTVTLGLRHEFQAPVLSEAHNPARLGNLVSRDGTYITGSAFHNYTKKQFSPRIGLAYDPFNDGKTVIRAGFGMFYDQVSWEALSNNLMYNLPSPSLLGFFGITGVPAGARGTPSNPTLPPIPFPQCPATANGGSTCTSGSYIGMIENVLEPVSSPTSLQWNLQVERELPGGFKVSAAYTGARAYHVMRGLEGNSSKPCGKDANGRDYFGATPGACGTEAAPSITAEAFSVFALAFDGQTNYNAGTFGVSRKFGSGFTVNASYTFAKAMSNSDTYNNGCNQMGNPGHSADPLDPMVDWSESMFSVRHRITMNGLFELPVGRGKSLAGNVSGWKQVLLGGWALNPLMDIHSGIPFDVLAGNGVAISNVNDFVSQPDRPNMLTGNNVLGGINEYFNRKAFALGDPGYLGNAPRNSVRGPGFTEVDLSLTKQFKTSEKTNLEFRAEAFNIINHPNFDLPFNQLYTPASPGETDKTSCNLTPAQAALYSCNQLAGQITRTVGTPRQLQLALKFTF